MPAKVILCVARLSDIPNQFRFHFEDYLHFAFKYIIMICYFIAVVECFSHHHLYLGH
jgi:hypothetical protein